MYIKRLLAIIVLSVTCFSILTSYVPHDNQVSEQTVEFAFYPPELKKTVMTLQKLPEFRILLAQISQEGKVGIEMAPSYSESFDAMWDSSRRVIMVNPNKRTSEGNLICSIIFEMHNASTDKQFVELVKKAREGSISKDDFVLSVERMEHDNCLKTIAILQKGMANGIFPDTSKWKVFKNFEDHYKIQQIHGHSGWLADSYDRYRNQSVNRNLYKGTIVDLHNLQPEDKRMLTKFFSLKYSLENATDDEKEKDLAALKEEYVSINYFYLGGHINGVSNKKRFMDEVFKGYPDYEKLNKESLWGQITKN